MAHDIVEDMRDSYAQRATTYERVYHKPERQTDLRAMEAWLAQAFAGRRVLELACGTGWWTPHGASDCLNWLATDLNPETMVIAQTKALPEGNLQFAPVDAYTFAALDDTSFDAAFAGGWWSHVPLACLRAWLEALHARLEPGALVVILDNRFVPTSSTPISHQDATGNTYQMHTLDDGSVHEMLKNYPSRDQAFAALGPRARDPQWIDYDHYWMLCYTLD